MFRTFGAMMSATAVVTALLLIAISGNSAPAQPSEPRKAERIDDLLGRGFEIKAVMQSPTGPRLILQSGARIYNCDGYRLGTDVPATLPAPGIGIDRSWCFTVRLR